MIASGKQPLLAAVTAVVLLGSTGCAAKSANYGCGTIDALGGPVLGDWTIDGNHAASSACTFEYDRVTSGDWCSQLVYDANGVRQVYLGHPTMQLRDGKLSFTPDGKFTSRLTFESPAGSAHTTFPYACLTAYGREPSCGDFTDALNHYLNPDDMPDPGASLQSFRLTPLQLLPYYPVGLVPQPSYSGIACTENTTNGCDCTYSVALVIPDSGSAATVDTTLTLYSDTSAPPYINDYTSDAAGLTLTGRDGFDVLGQMGLRLLTFVKP